MNKLKQTLFSNWTIRRALYVGLGALIVFTSIERVEWLGISIGGYFLAMGLLNFGCAGGACSTNNLEADLSSNSQANLDDVSYQEVKTK